MKIAIIGSGWFGCHLANILKKKFDIIIFEKENSIFRGQSGFNSNRLHLGFHYPRAKFTRNQCKKSFVKFKTKYSNLVSPIKFNYIGIHKNSKVSFKRYVEIMKRSNLRFDIVKNLLNLKNITGLIKCPEMLINRDSSKNYFKRKLKDLKIKFNFKVFKISNFKDYATLNNNKEKFDWVIDCSGCSIKKIKNFNLLYEPRITLVYKSLKKDLAIMLMDGKYWSIYPMKDKLYTLGSVMYSRLSGGSKNKSQAEKVIKRFTKNKLIKVVKKFEDQVSNDYPSFKSCFKYHSYYTSIATINNSIRDERPFKIFKKKRTISVLGGKIDTVIEAGEKIEKLLKK